MAGHTSPRDAEKIMGVLNGLVDAGVIKNRKLTSVKDGDFEATASQLRDYIRQSFISEPDRRSLPISKLRQFQRFLDRRDINALIPESVPRVSTRESRPTFR
jgi:hypothetical protein